MIDDRTKREAPSHPLHVSNAPLLPWAIGMIVGIAIESRTPCSPWFCATVVVAIGISALLKLAHGRLALLMVIGAAVCLGAIRHHVAFRAIPHTDVARYATNDRMIAKVIGTIATPPNTYRTGYDPFEPWLHTTDRTTFVLDLDRIDVGNGLKSVTGQTRISISEPTLSIREGDRIEAVGWLAKSSPPRNPGQHNWALHNARRGVRTRLQCDRTENISILQSSTDRSRSPTEQVRQLLLGQGMNTGDASSSLLDTMVLGHRFAVSEKIERLFLETGCAHYLAVSGVHIAMLASIVWFPARLLGAGRRLAAALLIATVITYVLIADARPSMLRAALMAVIFSVALLMRRRVNTINSLSLAALILLAINPVSLFDIGFQLSFAAVTGIILLTPVLMQLANRAFARKQHFETPPTDPFQIAIDNPPRFTWSGAVLRSTLMLTCVSIAAWVSTLPIVATHFGRLAPLGWLGSIAAFMFVYAVMVLSFMKLAVGLLFPFATAVVDAPLEFATTGLRNVLQWIRDTLGGPTDVTPPTVFILATYYVGLFGVVAVNRRGWTLRKSAPILACAILTIALWNWPAVQTDALKITQFAVGRGTATLIELPDGQSWIYDAGSSSPSDPGENTILPLLRERRISALDGIIISHANLDHYGGVPSIVRHKNCKRIYVNTNGAIDESDGPIEVLMQALRKSRQPIEPLHAGDSLDWGEDVNVEVHWPPTTGTTHLSANDQSIVVRIEFQNKSILMTGDIGFAAQQSLIAQGNLKSDILILPHHGAVESNTAAFIEAVCPTHIVRSSFVKNEDSPTLGRIVGSTPIHNTADHGAIQIKIRNGETYVSPFPGSQP